MVLHNRLLRLICSKHFGQIEALFTGSLVTFFIGYFLHDEHLRDVEVAFHGAPRLPLTDNVPNHFFIDRQIVIMVFGKPDPHICPLDSIDNQSRFQGHFKQCLRLFRVSCARLQKIV